MSRIDAEVTITGQAEEILQGVRALRVGQRSVLLTAWLPSRRWRGMREDHMLPAIGAGRTDDALEALARLHRQTLIDSELDRRLATLIDGFGVFTR